MTQEGVEFSSEITVKLIRTWGTDKVVPETARVSSIGDEEYAELLLHEGDEYLLTQGDMALIDMLSENGHTSPFEHIGATFFLDVPIFVMREWMRHRTQSYNEVSGRWKVLDGRFYVPDENRPTKQVGRTGEYSFVPDRHTNAHAQMCIKMSCEQSWSWYQAMLSSGVAKEVARMVLPVNIYTQVIVSANYLNWVRFLNLRAAPQAMHEIRDAAYQVKGLLNEAFPVSTAAWFKDEA
jgi:thymidylate synthase (FAD)